MQRFLAIADPTRRQIVERLAECRRTAGELVKEFDLRARAIFPHRYSLRQAGLFTTRAAGQSRMQALNPDGFDDREDWFAKTRSVWSRRLGALEHELRAVGEANERTTNKLTSS